MNVKNDFIIVDVGARSKLFFFEALKECTRLFAFEPNANAMQALKSKYKHHPFKELVFEDLALGNTNENATLNSTFNESMSSLLLPDEEKYRQFYGNNALIEKWVDAIRTQQTQAIRLDTLDAYTKAHKLAYVNLLKIDVQGTELNVLKGCSALLKKLEVGVIKVEFIVHPVYQQQQNTLTNLLLFMQEHGYALLDLLPGENAYYGLPLNPNKGNEYAFAGGDALFYPEAIESMCLVKKEKLAQTLMALGYNSLGNWLITHLKERDHLFEPTKGKRSIALLGWIKHLLYGILPPFLVYAYKKARK